VRERRFGIYLIYLEGSIEPSAWKLDRKGYQASDELLKLLLEVLHLVPSVEPNQCPH
jgi:hypothetical protein